MWIYLALLIFLAALVLLWQSNRGRKAAGLPGGKVVYTDTRAWGPVEKPLYDAELGLTGKPDYLVEQNGRIIPVEVKTSRIPEAPYDSHIYQLAAYCLLVQRQLGQRPPHGILHYKDSTGQSRTFTVDYTPQLEQALLNLLADMRQLDRRKTVARSHEEAGRCRKCGYRSVCPERLPG